MSLKSLLESCLPQSTNIGKIVRNLKARNITYDQILNSNESDLQQTLCDGGVQRKYRRKIIARVKKLQSTNGSSPVSSTNIKKNFKLKINKAQKKSKTKNRSKKKLHLHTIQSSQEMGDLTEELENDNWLDLKSNLVCRLKLASINVANIEQNISDIKQANTNLTQMIEYQYELLFEKLMNRKSMLLHSVAHHAQKQMRKMAILLNNAMKTQDCIIAHDNEVQFILSNEDFNENKIRNKIKIAVDKHQHDDLSLIKPYIREQSEVSSMIYTTNMNSFDSCIRNMDGLSTEVDALQISMDDNSRSGHNIGGHRASINSFSTNSWDHMLDEESIEFEANKLLSDIDVDDGPVLLMQNIPNINEVANKMSSHYKDRSPMILITPALFARSSSLKDIDVNEKKEELYLSPDPNLNCGGIRLESVMGGTLRVFSYDSDDDEENSTSLASKNCYPTPVPTPKALERKSLVAPPHSLRCHFSFSKESELESSDELFANCEMLTPPVSDQVDSF